MARPKSINPYRLAPSIDIRKGIDVVVNELERCGRTITTGSVSKHFSRCMRKLEKDRLVFTWSPKLRKSIIVVPPKYKLVKTKNNKIRIDNNKF